MPVVASGQIYREPTPILHEGRHGLGRQDSRREGHCFALLRFGALAGEKVLERFPLTEDGWARAWAALDSLDRDAAAATRKTLEQRAARQATHAAERQRRAAVYEALMGDGASRTLFCVLGVQVLADSGEIYTIGTDNPLAKTTTSRLLGLLAGAEAIVTDGSQAWSPGRAVLMPVALAGLATKTKAHAAVVFANGHVHTTELDGNSAVREAQLQTVQLQTVQFNALVGAAVVPVASAVDDPAVKLRKLKEMLDEGLLTQDEYTAKRTEVIKSL
jgi:hypothetical protein